MEKERKQQILVVDDDAVNLSVLQQIFRRSGYQVQTARSGVEALDLLERLPVDLVLLDVVLGVEDGFEVLSHIKQESAFRYVFVVLITGQRISPQAQARGLELGADGYLTRPIERRELVARVKAFMRHKRTIDALRRSEVRFRKIIEQNPDAILIVDKLGRIQFANPVAQNLFQLTQEELFKHNFGYPVIIDAYTEIDIVRRDENLVAEMRMIEIDWEGQRVFLISIRDITRQKELETQLRQTQKLEAIGGLAGGVAHDFNNILAGISAYTELLKSEQPAQPEVSENLDRILALSDRGRDLTAQLLRFARKSDIKLKQVDLHQRIRQVVGILRRTVDRLIEIEMNLGAERHHSNADLTQIENALLNIGINARDAMPNGGKLTFSTRNVTFGQGFKPSALVPPGDYVEISIKDTGIGMDEMTRQRIFEPFFTTKAIGVGTGLGLATVHGIMEQHEGHIKVVSQVGAGTEFLLYFKVVDEEGEAPAAEAPPVPAVSAAAEESLGHLLIIDDEALIREPICELLETADFTTHGCADGYEGLEYFRVNSELVDLVLLDLIMPHMGGLECFREIRLIRPDVKVLVASGFAESEQRDAIMAEGALGFISKPYRFQELLALIHKILAA